MLQHYLILGGILAFVAGVVALRFTVAKDQPDRPDATLL
jgi:hypothetical protein